MKILHLDLKLVGDQYAEFRFFWDNPNDYQSRQLPLAEIADLIQKAETDYYTRLPEDYATTGQALYNWLDGNDRNLQREIDKHWRSGIVLAIATTERLAHLPWEVLHDGKSFLVKRKPGIVPIRWVKDENSRQLILEDAPADRALNVLFMATSPRGVEPELDFEAEEAQVLSATKRQPLCLTVEESGCLTELGYLLKDYDQEHFDVVHLTGHATFRDEEPVFITETEFGEAQYSSAEDIASELQFQQPKLVFLSGCNTGYSRNEGAVPSMAEALLHQGATAVIGWGQRVRDIDKGKFNLEGLEYWRELNGRNCQNLPEQVKRGIDRRYLSSIVLLQETAKSTEEADFLKQIVFERLNSGGEKLTPQETRNALRNGKFNQLCIKLAENDSFRRMWKLPLESEGEEKLLESESYRKMEDVELVLRFFAYRHIEYFKSPVDKFLDDYLKQANNYSDETIKELENLFNETIDLVFLLFGDGAFIPPKEKRDNQTPLKTIYDPMMQAMANYISKKQILLTNHEFIRNNLYSNKDLLYVKEENNRPLFDGRYNNKKDVQARIKYFQEFLQGFIS